MAGYISYAAVERYCKSSLNNTRFKEILLTQVNSRSLLTVRNKRSTDFNTIYFITYILIVRYLLYTLSESEETQLFSTPDILAKTIINRVKDLSLLDIWGIHNKDPKVITLFEYIKKAPFKTFCNLLNTLDRYKSVPYTAIPENVIMHLVNHKEYNIYDLCKYAGLTVFSSLGKVSSQQDYDVFRSLLSNCVKNKRILILKFQDTLIHSDKILKFLQAAIDYKVPFKATFTLSSQYYNNSKNKQEILSIFPKELVEHLNDQQTNLLYYSITYKPKNNIVYKIYNKQITKTNLS